MYRAAIIGLGRMGSTIDDEVIGASGIFPPYAHAPAYVETPGVSLVAGADPHDEQRTLFGKRWGVGEDHLYTDYREMLEAEKPDILSVCTTARLRAQIMIDAVKAGVKAIWAEKPLAISLEEADAIVAACGDAGTAVAIHCRRRWNPFFMQARKLIDEGAIGDVLQVTGYGQCGLSHNGSHLIDTIRYFAGGNVEWVFGEMESDEAAAGENDLMGNGYLAFDNGVRAYLRGMPTGGAASWEFDVIGSEGRIALRNNGQRAEYTMLTEGGRRGRPLPVQADFPLPPVIEGIGIVVVKDLIAGIEQGTKPLCSELDGHEALEVAVALRESHRRGGQRVDLPLADRSLRILSSEIRNDDVPARVRRGG